MKCLFLVVLMGLLISCSTHKKSYMLLKENELTHTRRYIGNFVDYYCTDPEIFAGISLIWIKTTLYTNYGQLSAYGKVCRFSPDDRLYLKSTYSTSGSFGNWVYEIENEFSVSYRVSEYRYDDRVMVQNMFK